MNGFTFTRNAPGSCILNLTATLVVVAVFQSLELNIIPVIILTISLVLR